MTLSANTKALRGAERIVPVLRCRYCPVRNRAVCGAMSDEQIARLSDISHRRTYAAGQMIMSDQEPVTFFANVVSGTIKLTKTISDGRQQIVGLLFPPDFLGRTFSRSNPYFAEAATDVEVCVFPSEGFERLIGLYPELQHRLFERTLDELDAAREWMVLLGRKTAEEKVASFLLMLARRSIVADCPDGGGAAVRRFDLPLRRADMADYLGLTIETVSRQLTRLRTAGIVRMIDARTLEVPELADLAGIAGQDDGL
ncbi:MAG: Crp/Fnr family transcriptional regulator [Parvibaculaceae bacterium]